MFLNILVAVDGSPAAMQAIAQAVDLARGENSSLTLICVAPPVSRYVTLAGVSTAKMAEELEKWADDVLRSALRALPEDIAAHRVQRSGDPGEEVVNELDSGRYDLIVLGSRARGRVRSNLFGSVNGYVHFHSRVPILSVPEDRNSDPLSAAPQLTDPATS